MSMQLTYFVWFNQGKQGPVEHIYRGILFIFDRHHLEHAGFICAKSTSCILVGGSRSSNGDRNVSHYFTLHLSLLPFKPFLACLTLYFFQGSAYSRFNSLGAPPRIPQSPGRYSRGGPPACTLLTILTCSSMPTLS